MNKLNSLLTGTGSISLIEVLPQVQQNLQLDAPAIVQSIIQLIVGIATLLMFFKKKTIINN